MSTSVPVYEGVPSDPYFGGGKSQNTSSESGGRLAMSAYWIAKLLNAVGCDGHSGRGKDVKIGAILVGKHKP